MGGTYCDLTVEFVIRVHGMSMGPISMSVIIIVSFSALRTVYETSVSLLQELSVATCE